MDPCRVEASSTVSTCRKSTARIPAAWARRNCRQVGPERRGAGSTPAACRISQTVDGATVMPSFTSSSWIRRCPQRILPGQAQHQPLDTRGGRRTAGPAPPARVVLLRRQPAVPGQQRRGRDREYLGPTPAWHNPCERGEPSPVRRLVPHPADLPAQHRILMPEHQHFGRSRPVAAEQHDDQAEYPAGQNVDDPEQHPPSQPSPCPACRRQRRSTTQIEYSSGTGCVVWGAGGSGGWQLYVLGADEGQRGRRTGRIPVTGCGRLHGLTLRGKVD